MFERIHELIRKGEVVLFCGAGMSIEAGYPSGNALAKTIYDALTDDEREQISQQLTLPDLSEAYIDLKLGKRHALIQILKKEFSKEPTSLRLHQMLLHTPQIKTIITTNYDTLFERAYGDQAVVIKSNADVSYIPADKIQIIKIHGDLSVPDSVLISKSDYTRFFDSQKQELLWTLVKERLATKTILFAGYNLDDINIESIFTKITEQLGSDSREVFMLAPNLPQLKIQSLMRKGINYLDTTAGIFFEGLQQNIRENINDDLVNGWVDAETYRKVLQLNKLNPKLTAMKDRYSISGVEAIDKQVTGSISFSIDSGNRETLEKVRKLFKEGDLSELVLDKSNTSNLSMYLNGIRFPGSEGEQLIFKPAPLASSEVDFIFNDDAEFEKIKADIYRSGDDIVFVIQLRTAELLLRLPASNLLDLSNFNSNITFKHVPEFQRPSEEIETFSFIYSLGSSGGISIHGKNFGKMKFRMAVLEPMIKEAEKNLYYFRGLKTLEKYFDVRFEEVKEITEKTFHILNNMLALAEGCELTMVWNESLLVQSEDQKVKEKVIADMTGDVQKNVGFYGEEPELVELHGQELKLGYRQTRVLEPFIENLEAVRVDPGVTIKIKSATDQVLITYSQHAPEP